MVVRKGEGLELLTLLKEEMYEIRRTISKGNNIRKESQYWGLKYSQTPHRRLPGEESMELSESCSLTPLHGLLTAFGENTARKIPNPIHGNYSHLPRNGYNPLLCIYILFMRIGVVEVE